MSIKHDEMVFVSDDPNTPLNERLSLRISGDDQGGWYVSIAPQGEVAQGSVRIRANKGSEIPGLNKAIGNAHFAIKNEQAEATLIQTVNLLVMKLGLFAIVIYLEFRYYSDVANFTASLLNHLGFSTVTVDSFPVLIVALLLQLILYLEIALRCMRFLQNKFPFIFGDRKLV